MSPASLFAQTKWDRITVNKLAETAEGPARDRDPQPYNDPASTRSPHGPDALARGAMPSAQTPETPSPSPDGDKLCYTDAIISQLHVKLFADSNNDGIFNFAGLTAKLDYL